MEEMFKMLHRWTNSSTMERRYPAEARNTQQQILWCCLSQATLTVISPRIKALSQYFTDLSKDFSLPHAAFL